LYTLVVLDVYVHTCIYTYKQTNKQTNKQTSKQTNTHNKFIHTILLATKQRSIRVYNCLNQFALDPTIELWILTIFIQQPTSYSRQAPPVIISWMP